MIFWVGQGNLLVTIGKGLTKTLKNGDEITPDLVKKSEKDEYGLSAVFIEKNTEAGNISDNPLAGKVQKNVNIMQNEIVRLRRENEELKGIIERNSGKAEKPAEPAKKGKAEKPAEPEASE